MDGPLQIPIRLKSLIEYYKLIDVLEKNFPHISKLITRFDNIEDTKETPMQIISIPTKENGYLRERILKISAIDMSQFTNLGGTDNKTLPYIPINKNLANRIRKENIYMLYDPINNKIANKNFVPDQHFLDKILSDDGEVNITKLLEVKGSSRSKECFIIDRKDAYQKLFEEADDKDKDKDYIQNLIKTFNKWDRCSRNAAALFGWDEDSWKLMKRLLLELQSLEKAGPKTSAPGSELDQVEGTPSSSSSSSSSSPSKMSEGN